MAETEPRAARWGQWQRSGGGREGGDDVEWVRPNQARPGGDNGRGVKGREGEGGGGAEGGGGGEPEVYSTRWGREYFACYKMQWTICPHFCDDS